MSGSSHPSDIQQQAVQQARQAIAEARRRAKETTQPSPAVDGRADTPGHEQPSKAHATQAQSAADKVGTLSSRTRDDVSRDLLAAADLVRRAETLLANVQQQLLHMHKLQHSGSEADSGQQLAGEPNKTGSTGNTSKEETS